MNTLIIEERHRQIGDFTVGRYIPYRLKRMIGPFIYMDRMGPAVLDPGKYLDVDQHPHIGLSTLTYLLDGIIEHRDSLGTVQEIRPGSVNWMTAGKGVTHTERTPAELRSDKTLSIHGYQIWVALPREKEDMNPGFHHIPAEDLPAWTQDELNLKLVAGTAFGRSSPVPVKSKMFMLEVISEKGGALKMEHGLYGETGVLPVEGNASLHGLDTTPGKMLVSEVTTGSTLVIGPGSHLLIIGGEPLPEKRFIHWNFVSSEVKKIDAARELWAKKEFPAVPGDETYVPLP